MNADIRNMDTNINDPQSRWPELTDEFLKKLRHWSTRHQLPEIPIDQLALFAHSCYWDEEATLKCMHVYYRQRSTIPELFANRDPKSDNLEYSLKAL